MRFNIISVVSAIYLVSGAFAAPAGNPDDAKTDVGQLGSELSIHTDADANPLNVGTALARNPQGSTVPSTIPTTTSSGTGTSVGQESSDLKPQAASIRIAGIINGSNTDQDESDTEISYQAPGQVPKGIANAVIQHIIFAKEHVKCLPVTGPKEIQCVEE